MTISSRGHRRTWRIRTTALVSALTLVGSMAAAIETASATSLGLAPVPAVATPQAEAAPPSKVTWGGKRSGLPWASGASSGASLLEAERGRPLDVGTTYTNRKGSWADFIASAGNIKVVTKYDIPVIGMGLFPDAYRGQHAQCAAGAFDGYMRQFGARLVAAGGARAVIRLGWEFNFVNKFAWGVTGTDAASAAVWKGCFRRWVTKLRATPGQAFTIVWNAATNGTHPNVDMLYPGNQYVDVIGTQYFDRCPPATTEALWQKRYNKRAKSGAPAGLGTWLAYAKSKGKRLAIPEWGIGGPSDSCRRPGIDNPFFIRKMHAFLRANAASIAYEAYFNASLRTGSHRLAPARPNPRSAAVYKSLW
jgi:hypothetical protein